MELLGFDKRDTFGTAKSQDVGIPLQWGRIGFDELAKKAVARRGTGGRVINP